MLSDSSQYKYRPSSFVISNKASAFTNTLFNAHTGKALMFILCHMKISNLVRYDFIEQTVLHVCVQSEANCIPASM